MSLSLSFSPYQESIFDYVKNENGSLIVRAVAGSGKTTTIVKALEYAPQALMLAFNSDIAATLKARVPANATAKTFHALGLSVWSNFMRGRIRGKVNVFDGKLWKIVNESDIIGDEKKAKMYLSFILKMVGLAKGAGIGAILDDTEENWLTLADHHDITPEHGDANLSEGIELSRKVLAESNRKLDTIDFNDMLYLPLRENITFPRFSFVGIDEAQDTNAVQRALLHKMLDAGGRLMAIGDEKQAIYGFRGADSRSMEMIKEEFDCIELPLTVSYRCATKIIAEAQTIVPYIEAADNAPEGIIAHNPVNPENTGESLPLSTNDAILCRNCAPLVKACWLLIGKGIPAKIMGRDIEKGLIDLIHKMDCKTIDELSVALSTYLAREVDKFTEQNKLDKAAALTDKVDCVTLCITFLPETKRSIQHLISAINSLFGNGEKGAVTLSTIHKSKGKEWERVFFLKPELIPSKWAIKDWQIEQESNLKYVGITRAMRALYYISEEWAETLARVEHHVDTEMSVDKTLSFNGFSAGQKVKVVKGRNVAQGIYTIERVGADSWNTLYLVGGGKTYPKNVMLV